MNFADATVEEEGTAVRLPGDIRLPLNGSAVPAWAGRKVTLGVRPEHLEIDRGGPGTVRLSVGQVELLGADTLVHGRIGRDGTALTVRLPDVHRFEKNATVDLRVPPEKVHLFDPETGRRIG
ncbi:MAG: TOBE domain-containing protein [Desulfobacterales bacterium]|nr:TOBE domain-containing protein [Desulfobacterales bacterium]